MRVFVKNSARPLRDREEKHVVAVGRRPIRHSHADAMAGHQTAHAKQRERGQRRQHGETVQPGIEIGLSHFAADYDLLKRKPLRLFPTAAVSRKFWVSYFASRV